MTNVIEVTPIYPHESNPLTGIFIKREVEALTQNGHTLSVISPTPWVPPVSWLPEDWKAHRNVPQFRDDEYGPVSFPRYFSVPGLFLLALSSLSCQLSMRVCRNGGLTGVSPDIIHAHMAIPTGLFAADLANTYDVPLVTTIHGTDFQNYLELPGCKRIIQRVFDQSEHVIVNSSKLENIGRREFENTSFSRIPNGTTLTPPPEQVPDTIDQDAFVIVSVSRLIEIKGHRYVLDAVDQFDHDNVQYIIIGDGPERAALETQADSVDSNVVFTGSIPNEDVFSYLWNADVFALPSYAEAFGIAYIEAMSCELPVIACAGEGPEDYITHEQNGFLVERHSSAEIAACLEQLSTDPELRNSIGKRARETIEAEYTWQQHAENVETVLQNAMQTYQS